MQGDLYFADADGHNGGIQFAVYDSRTGKKVFEDIDCLACMYLKKTYRLKGPFAPFGGCVGAGPGRTADAEEQRVVQVGL